MHSFWNDYFALLLLLQLIQCATKHVRCVDPGIGRLSGRLLDVQPVTGGGNHAGSVTQA